MAKTVKNHTKEKGRTKYPYLQSIIILSILGLVGLFFALNYLFYIPHQQRLYNDKVFRILGEEARDFETVIKGYADYFALTSNTKNTEDTTHLNAFREDTQNWVRTFKKGLTNSFKGYSKDTVQPTTYLIKPDSIILQIHSIPGQSNDTVYPIAIARIIESIQGMHANLFDRIMLVKKDASKKNSVKNAVLDTILYKSPGIAVTNRINSDSLLGYKGSLQFATIKDFSIEGASYKLFVLPFQLDNLDLLLIGFIPERKYNSNATTYTYPTLLFIASLLILIMISMPLIKIYLLSRQERITITDIRALMASMVIAPFIFFMAFSSAWLYYFADRQSDTLLDTLHQQAKRNFTSEIGMAIHQLRYYDSICTNPDLNDTALKYMESVFKVTSKQQKNKTDFKNVFFHPTIYKNLDDIFWVNKDGQQIAKWFFLNRQVTYLDLTKRQYFQNVRDGNLYFLPLTNDSFYIEPTISWATGEYSINIITRSNQYFIKKSNSIKDSAIMIALATSMYSVCNPVVPKGFNFCIINATGDILFHSETRRSLHENLFDESNQNYELRHAIFNKDSQLISSVRLYDRNVKLLVTPLEGMPFYLVSYFTEREQNLFVFHISAFTLLCTSLVLFSLLLFLLLYKFTGLKLSELNFSTYESAWMRPSENKNGLYKQIFSFQLATILLLLFFLLIISEEKRHWYILQASILLPFFVATGYYIIKQQYQQKLKEVEKYISNSKQILFFFKNNGRILIAYAIVHIVFLLCKKYLFYENGSGDHSWPDIAALISAIAVPIIAILSMRISFLIQNFIERIKQVTQKLWPDLKPKADTLRSTGYLQQYSTVIMLSIVMIAIMPTIGFFSYAFKEEVQMQIKSRQFYTAKRIEDRRDTINKFIKTTKLNWEPVLFPTQDSEYIVNRKLSTVSGIYMDAGSTLHSINNGSIVKGNKSKDESANIKLYADNSHFYKLITFFLFLPKDHTDFFNNNAPYYYWLDRDNQDSICMIYINQTDPVTAASLQLITPVNYSSIVSELFQNNIGWLLVVGILLILIQHYRFIIPLSRRIFLIDYFNIYKPDLTELNKIYASASLSCDDKSFFGNQPLTDTTIIDKEKECMGSFNQKLETGEASNCILRVQGILEKSYDQIWKACTDQEKFILYDFALDGFSNYKNADILFGLHRKGLVRKDPKDHQLAIMSYSFRNYLLAKTEKEEIGELKRQIERDSVWKNLRHLLFILFFAIIIFLFITQQEVSNKIMAIVTGLVSLVPALLKLFDRSFMEGSAAKKEL